MITTLWTMALGYLLIMFQSPNSWLSKFMQSYNFIKNKHRNEKDKEPE